jgi:hypothetical protein
MTQIRECRGHPATNRSHHRQMRSVPRRARRPRTTQPVNHRSPTSSAGPKRRKDGRRRPIKSMTVHMYLFPHSTPLRVVSSPRSIPQGVVSSKMAEAIGDSQYLFRVACQDNAESERELEFSRTLRNGARVHCFIRHW